MTDFLVFGDGAWCLASGVGNIGINLKKVVGV